MRNALFSFLFVGLLSATTAEAAPRTLTLDDALALARKNNHDLKAARARFEQAAASAQQAWVALQPQAVLTGRYTHNYKEIAPTLNVGMGMTRTLIIQKQEQLDGLANVSVPLVIPWAYFGVEAAKASQKSAAGTYGVSETAVLVATAQAYYQAAGADEVRRARQSAVTVRQQGLGNAQARMEAGSATRVDVERAELEVVRAQQSDREAAYGQAQAYRALATLTQLETTFVALPVAVTPAPPETDAGRALQLRPEFAALAGALHAADAQAKSSAWRWAPTVSAFGQARVSNYSGFSADNYAWAIGAQLDWALWDGGLRGVQHKVAEAQRRETAERIEQLRDGVRDELANSTLLVDTKREALRAAEQSVALARSTLALVQVQYENGATIQLNLIQAQGNVVDAEVGLAQARFDLAIADLAARRAAGTFPAK